MSESFKPRQQNGYELYASFNPCITGRCLRHPQFARRGTYKLGLGTLGPEIIAEAEATATFKTEPISRTNTNKPAIHLLHSRARSNGLYAILAFLSVLLTASRTANGLIPYQILYVCIAVDQPKKTVGKILCSRRSEYLVASELSSPHCNLKNL